MSHSSWNCLSNLYLYSSIIVRNAADVVAYLGMPGGSAGGTRAGLEGISGTFGSKPDWAGGGPGRVGTGGAPNAGEGFNGGAGPGVGPLTAGGRFGGGAVAEAGRIPAGGLR